MKKVSTAIVMASISALAQQAHAANEIKIDSGLVSQDISEEIRKSFESMHVKSSIQYHSPLIGEQLTVDGKPSEIKVDNLINLAARATGKGDSVNAVGDASIDSVCYGNCHSACHGSRGWR